MRLIDGMCLADALGGKPLHVLIDFCGPVGEIHSC
jgi:hypothetical protein